MDLIRGAGLALGVDPLGGAGLRYWPAIADRYQLKLTTTNTVVDPTFRFMDVDWDGRIRMDRFAVRDAFADRSQGQVRRRVRLRCRSRPARRRDTAAGLLPANHYLAACIHYCSPTVRPGAPRAAVGKTVVSSRVIDCVAAGLGRTLYEVPVGFKWFVDGLLSDRLGFAGEESAGATFLRRNGYGLDDRKGRHGRGPAGGRNDGARRTGSRRPLRGADRNCGEAAYERIDAPATPRRKPRSRASRRPTCAATSAASPSVRC